MLYSFGNNVFYRDFELANSPNSGNGLNNQRILESSEMYRIESIDLDIYQYWLKQMKKELRFIREIWNSKYESCDSSNKHKIKITNNNKRHTNNVRLMDRSCEELNINW